MKEDREFFFVLAKEDSENITNQSHKDAPNSCPVLVNLQIVVSVRCEFLHIGKQLILKQEK